MKIVDPSAVYQLIGHRSVERQLMDGLAAGTLAHSLIFAGTKGVGKATMAFRFARYVLSGAGGAGALFAPSDMTVDAAAAISSRIEAGSHGDLLVIRPDEKGATATIKVDEIRKIGHFLSLTPAESQWRIVIVDAADDMNPNAANALLKLLEEPPAYCFIILIAHAPQRLLPTIRSRCRMVDFNAHAIGDFAAILSAAKLTLLPQDLATLYGMAHGSAGLALRLADQDAPALYDQLLRTLSPYPDHDAAALAELLKRLTNAKEKEVWDVWQQVWNWWIYRASMVLHGVEVEPSSPQEAETLARWQQTMTPERLEDIRTQAEGWFADTKVLHLDRKQVIHSLLAMMAA